jgi:hypothetical protein
VTAEPVFCTECHGLIDDGTSRPPRRAQHYQLARLPGGATTGELWRFCSLRCLERFVTGGAS